MEHRRGQFAGDLVHVGQHQHQPLTGGEGGGERPACRAPCTVPAAPPFALHLHHRGDVAPQVGLPLCRPGVGQFGHGRARGDGVDGTHFAQLVRHPGRGFVAVNHDQFMFHWDSSGWRSSMAWQGALVVAGTAAGAALGIHLIPQTRPQLGDGLLGATAVAAVALEAVAAGVAARRLVAGCRLVQPADDLAKVVPRRGRFDRLAAGRRMGLEPELQLLRPPTNECKWESGLW